ncbi:MAG: M28 family peptidase [Anaerolineales bacterium]|nr:M28 family peptidase [Anaerolineales bacterium]
MNKPKIIIYLSVIALLALLTIGYYALAFSQQAEFEQAARATATARAAHPTEKPAPVSFDSSQAYADVQTQVAFGARTPGSAAHAQVREWLRAELESAGWSVEIQEASRLGHPIFNLIAKRTDEAPQIILGAHYDTRLLADNDADSLNKTKPGPGANDGASGVAVLLELARSLPKDTVPVWLVFFDAEDQGRLEGWDWILGSQVFVDELKTPPRAAVIVDMIGDANLNIHFEKNSDSQIRQEIWESAASLGHGDVFIPTEKFSMLDDHTPFLNKGIPAVDIIDFDYPDWHTAQDTPDKVSAKSLGAVGETLWLWIVNQKP